MLLGGWVAAAVAFVLLSLLLSLLDPKPSSTATATPTAVTPEERSARLVAEMEARKEHATVTRVIDGDTIDVLFPDGTTARVRYADIDTPEQGEECYEEATARNRELVEGKAVTLTMPFDPDNRVDRYGRLVRDVAVAGHPWVNWELVFEGLAYHWGDPWLTWIDEWGEEQSEITGIAQAEITAMQHNKGCLWAP